MTIRSQLILGVTAAVLLGLHVSGAAQEISKARNAAPDPPDHFGFNDRPLDLVRLDGDRILSVAFSPDGRRLATASGPQAINQTAPGELRLYDADTHKLLARIE